jgi:branched-chain amino acid transport system permease protein
VVAWSQDLCMGRTGLFAVAPAAFFGLGAYTTALLTTDLEWPLLAAILAGGLLTTVVAAVTGVVLLRLTGHFLALATLGFGVIFLQVLALWPDVTHGSLGVTGIPALYTSEFVVMGLEVGPSELDYLTALALLVVTALTIRRLARSRIGLVLLSIRDDSLAAESAGVNVPGYRLAAYSLSAGLAALAGGLYATQVFVITPENFSFDVSLLVIMIVVIGGRLSSVGISTAAVIMIFLPEYLRGVADYRMIIYGALVLLCIIFIPGGIAGLTRKFASHAANRVQTWRGGTA